VAQNEAGQQLAVWCDLRSGSDDIYAVLISPEGTPLWNPEGVVVCSHPAEQVNPTAVAVPDGWIIFWVDHRAGSGISIDPSFGDIYAQKLNASGNRQWNANAYTGVVIDTVLSWVVLADPLVAAPDGEGGAFVAWNEYRATQFGNNFNVMVQHVDGNGSGVWPTSLMAAENMSVHDNSFGGTGDGEGNLIVAWSQWSSSGYKAIVAKISADGARLWGDGGRMILCDGITSWNRLSVAKDGTGGCYVGWMTAYSNASGRVQRFTAEGDTVFPAAGVIVCHDVNEVSEFVVATDPVTDGDDGCVAAWLDNRSGGWDPIQVYGQKVTADGSIAWMENGILVGDNQCGGGTDHGTHNVSVQSDGDAGLVCSWIVDDYNDWYGGDIFASRITSDGTIAWGSGCTPVCTTPAKQLGARAVVGYGNSSVYWLNVADSETSLRLQRLDMASGQGLLQAEGEFLHRGICARGENPQTLLLGAGRYVAVWEDTRSWTHRVLYYQVFDAAGQVEGPVNGQPLPLDSGLCANEDQTKCRLCADGSGGFYVVYISSCNGSTPAVRFAHVNSADDAVTPAGGLPVYSGTELLDCQDVTCLADGDGGLYVGWSVYDLQYVLRLMVQRVNANHEVLWTNPTPLGIDNSDATLAGLATGADGKCLVLWTSGWYYTQNVFGSCVRADGSVEWTTSVTDTAGQNEQACAIGDGIGGVYCTWQKSTDWSKVIYSQHVLADGQRAWQAGGVLLSPASWSEHPLVAHDRHGNAYVSWLDSRADPERFEIYAQKINAAGDAVWEPGGRPACVGAAVYSWEGIDYDMQSDAGDGIYLAWTDRRDIRDHIYAMHLDSSGHRVNALAYDESGLLTSTHWDEQYQPRLCSDGLGGVIVTYVDNKGIVEVEEPPQIYAQRLLDSYMGVPEKPVAEPLEFALYQNYPNPFNPSTEIRFDLPQESWVELKVYNLLGQMVTTLINNVRPAGAQRVAWDGTNGSGVTMPSGVYVYRLEAGTNNAVKKMVLVR
jgi:hypothetical protein